MDEDKDIKFNFFKKHKKEPLILKHYNKIALGLVFTPFVLAIFISSLTLPRTMSYPVTSGYENSYSGYVSLVKAMDTQESLIDTVQNLDLNNAENTINEIQKLGLSIRNIGFRGDNRIYTIGYKDLLGMTRYAILLNEKNETKITWKSVGQNSIFLAEQWDHDGYPIKMVDNKGDLDIELIINSNKDVNKIKDLEEKLLKLQEENELMKKKAEKIISNKKSSS